MLAKLGHGREFTGRDWSLRLVQPNEFGAFCYDSVEISKKQLYGTLNATSGGAGIICPSPQCFKVN